MVTALKILGDIMPVFGPAPELTPRSSGGLDIEWEGDFGELSITVAPTGQPTAYHSSPTGDEWESLLDERLGDVRAILEANRIAPPTIG